MDVLVTALLLIAFPLIAGKVASNKGRSFAGFFALALVTGMGSCMIALNISKDGVTAACVGIGFAVASIIAAYLATPGTEIAAQSGSYGDYVKCPHCAEPVRLEAILCKHCHSDLKADSHTPG